ncbi:type II toxin-antitoxin system HipA family toxin [Pantoea cypripedii]|uniref:type II toxin-antitoxin system HipA family toxin n=1 Tax=Pantoea cypripedii TaxID=55209 RepID=UPI001AE35ED5|nr:type II toxin-antitoxin system HipA family toxin [Pantoea cypripedii]MBP2198914.1 serine/threonine-protein kinase HipA [Pantoea cypripedii]
MISEQSPQQAFVWIWLPGETSPVVSGRLSNDNAGNLVFNYGRSYLERIRDQPAAIPIYLPELPLQSGVLPLLPGLTMPSAIRDSAPDAWGRRVIINRKLGVRGADTDTALLDELTYLLESGSDRIGALDFQRSATDYEPRSAKNVEMEELLRSAERVERGIPLTPELDQALFHGSSIGGARPKALIEEQGKKYIAKFSASNDLYSVVKAEFIAMRLGSLCGLDCAPVLMTHAGGKDILLIERFDRIKTKAGWTRRSMVSALTLFGLDDMMARYASYEEFAQLIRQRFERPKETLRELFARICFNILCGNTDDHARNHAAFWNGERLSLTPAYDICPQGRAGNEATQAMLINGNNRLSQRSVCLETAHNFLLSQEEALEIFDAQVEIITSRWNDVCDEAELSEVDRRLFWKRQFLNPFVFE